MSCITAVAAEEGWKVASEVSFYKKGNMADPELAKALKNKKKREAEGAKEKKPKKKRNFGNGGFQFQSKYSLVRVGNNSRVGNLL